MIASKLPSSSSYQCICTGCRSQSGSRYHGFTLIEMLVVIAILSMLVAVLIPSLNAARQAAKRVSCQNNLRSIANAWTEYLDDHDDYFLQGINTNVNYGGKQGKCAPVFGSVALNPAEPDEKTPPVPKPLNGYLSLPEVIFKGAEVFQCPADKGSRDVQPSYFECIGTSYQTNNMLIGQDQMWFPPNARCADVLESVNEHMHMMNRTRVFNPAKVILMGDYGWWATYVSWDDSRIEWHGIPESHNVAFLDTRVEFIRIRKGIHVTPKYSVIPLKGPANAAIECQEEGPLDF